MSCERPRRIEGERDGAAVFKPDSILHYALASNSQVRTHAVAVWPDTEEWFSPRFGLSARPLPRAREALPRPHHQHPHDSISQEPAPYRTTANASRTTALITFPSIRFRWSPDLPIQTWRNRTPRSSFSHPPSPCSVSYPMYQQIAPSDGCTCLRLLPFYQLNTTASAEDNRVRISVGAHHTDTARNIARERLPDCMI